MSTSIYLDKDIVWSPTKEGIPGRVPDTIFEPQSEAQRQLIEDMTPVVLYHGPWGSGKTHAGAAKGYTLGYVLLNNAVALIRKKRVDLKPTLWKKFIENVLPQDRVIASNESDLYRKLDNGAEFFGIGLDSSRDVNKLASREYGCVVVEEASEITEDDFELKIMRCMRLDVPFHQIILLSNPSGPGHWLFRRFFQDKLPGYREIASEILPNLPPSYYKLVDSLTGVYRERYKLGKWVSFEGVVYPFDPRKHVITKADFKRMTGFDEIPKSWRRALVVDFGFDHPFVCYDEETDILTKQGWVKFAELPEGCHVGTVNMVTHKFEWQVPTSYIKQYYTGYMVHGASRQQGANFCVTPNHKMVYFQRKRKKNEWRMIDADSLGYDMAIPVGWESLDSMDGDIVLEIPFPCTGRGLGRGRKFPLVRRVDFARFLGLWLAEGDLRKSSGGHYVRISQKVHIEEVRDIIKALKCRWSEYIGKNGVMQFSIGNVGLYKFLEACCGKVKSKEKRIPTFIFDWGADSLKALLDGLMLGDGHRATYDEHTGTMLSSCSYATSSKGLADDVQAVASILGLPTRISKRVAVGGYTEIERNVYSVTLNKYKSSVTGRINIKTVPYSGYVYCVSVSNSTVVVRRRGRPMVCGNCQWWAISPSDVYFMYREIYHTQRTVTKHAPVIKHYCELDGIEPKAICDHDAEDSATLRENGIKTIKARKSRLAGQKAVYDKFDNDQIYYFDDTLIELDQRLAINKRPTKTVEEYPNYVWANLKTKEDMIRENDHGMDDTRYLVYTLQKMGYVVVAQSTGRTMANLGIH